MTPRRYRPLAYVPIHRRLPLTWPDGARVALWVNPNVEFFSLDDVMPSNLNDRVPREQAKIPDVINSVQNSVSSLTVPMLPAPICTL